MDVTANVDDVVSAQVDVDQTGLAHEQSLGISENAVARGRGQATLVLLVECDQVVHELLAHPGVAIQARRDRVVVVLLAVLLHQEHHFFSFLSHVWAHLCQGCESVKIRAAAKKDIFLSLNRLIKLTK